MMERTRRHVHFGCVQINEFSTSTIEQFSWDQSLRCTLLVDLDDYKSTRHPPQQQQRRRRRRGNKATAQNKKQQQKRKRDPLAMSPTKQRGGSHKQISTTTKRGGREEQQQENKNEASLQAAMDDIEKRTAQLAQKLHSLGAAPLQ